MSNYITRASFEMNGTVITDFKSVTEKEYTVSKVVPLMYKTGSAKLTKRWQLEVVYVVPPLNAFDWDSVVGGSGSITLEYDSGERVDYGGVSVLTVAPSAIDGENELTRTVTFTVVNKNGDTGSNQ